MVKTKKYIFLVLCTIQYSCFGMHTDKSTKATNKEIRPIHLTKDTLDQQMKFELNEFYLDTTNELRNFAKRNFEMMQILENIRKRHKHTCKSTLLSSLVIDLPRNKEKRTQ